MRKYLPLFLLITLLWQGPLAAQMPVISVQSDSLRSDLMLGDSTDHFIVIKNTGNRDLQCFIKASGPSVSFRKNDYADWTLAENQDRITKDVWITRADEKGIFNFYSDTGYTQSSPDGTEWSFGYTSDLSPSDYELWQDAVLSYPPKMVGKPMSVHLTGTDIYFDLIFHSWTGGGNGGGFSYIRGGVAPWINPAHDTILVLPGRADTVRVRFNSNETPGGGQYSGYIIIMSNDTLHPDIQLDASLKVTGVADIRVVPSSLSFGKVFKGAVKKLNVSISNKGSGLLVISDITTKSGTPVFVSETSGDTILPVSADSLGLTFNPSDIMVYNDTLLLYTNDPDSAVVEIPVSGEGIAPGKIDLSAPGFVHDLTSGETTQDTLIIRNTGSNDLYWAIDFRTDKGPVTVTKQDYADINLPENQDRITPDVWIIRGNQKGIFNIASENGYTDNYSPEGTEWAWGKTKYDSSADYTNWRDALNSNPPDMVGNYLSMHLIKTNRYFDVLFKQWTGGGSGGGFSYSRTEVPAWLKSSSYEGNIPSGSEEKVVITFDASSFYAGDYQGIIVVSSNDPDQQETMFDATLSVSGTPRVHTDTTLVNFGEVYKGGTKAGKTVISNTGTDTLHITGMENDSTEFTTSVSAMIIPPGESQEMTITFFAADTLLYQDTLRIYSDDPDTPVFKLPLSGQGVYAPVLKVNVGDMTTELMSGETTSGSIQFDNFGLNPLTWTVNLQTPNSTVTFTKKNYADWTLSENQDRISDSVMITRQDTRGIFNIAKESAYNAKTSASPVGTLWAPGPSKWQDAGSYDYWINAVGHNPPSSVGKILSLFIPPENRYFDVIFHSWSGNNSGGGFSYARTEIPAWLSAASYQDTLQADGTKWLQIFFDAKDKVAGVYKSDFIIHSNDPVDSIKVIPITMIVHGIPDILTDKDSILFGDIYTGYPDTAVLTLQNIGTDTLFVTGASFETSDFVAVAPDTILAGETALLEVSFAGSGLHTYSDTLHIMSNDPDQHELKIPVKANLMQPPEIALNVSEYTMQLYDNETYTDTLVISNTGNSFLKWSLNSPSWVNISMLGDSLPAGEKDSLIVTFDASVTGEGDFDSIMVIESNDPAKPVIHIPVRLHVSTIKITHPLPDVLVNEGFGNRQIDFSDAFDYSGNPLSYIVVSSDTGVATVDTLAMMMTITEQGTGTSVITIRADDGAGHVVFDDFLFRVNANPIVMNPIADFQLDRGFSDFSIDLDTVFYDSDGDTLNYSFVSSVDTAVTVSLKGSVLTLHEITLGGAEIYLSAGDGIGTAARDTFKVLVVSPQSVNDLERNQLTVYPNPVRHIMTIDMKGSPVADVTLQITDIIGKVVYEKHYGLFSQEVIPAEDLQTGIYFIRIFNEKGNFLRKIIKE